jgi:hypothetical protein
MPIAVSFRRLAAFAFLFSAVRVLSAQPLLVGNAYPFYAGQSGSTSVTTYVQRQLPASAGGDVTSVVFGWSASPCPAAVKIKFFRIFVGGVPQEVATQYAERGPFDVTAPVQSGGFTPPVVQTVTLDPPVTVKAGDVIGITNLTPCGAPTYSGAPAGLGVPSPAPSSEKAPGDVATVSWPLGTADPPVFVFATGTGSTASTLELLGRFQVGLSATDPRTGRQTVGTPVPLGNAAGFFSLPGFTGDATFPEVIVKMVDATGAPSLGGGFWFFHAPLTDVAYTLSVLDTTTGATRTYHNASGSPGQICGGVDTSAFPP